MSTLREELNRLYEQHGKIEPQIVVEAARDADRFPAWHAHLEWDDAKAGHQHRLNQVRRTIRTIKIDPQEFGLDEFRSPVRAYHSLPDNEGFAYRKTEDIVQDPFQAKLLLQQAEREWRAMFAKYKHLDEFIAAVREDLNAA